MSMTLKEAIEIVGNHQAEDFKTEATDIHFALLLLIEAGKYVLSLYDPDHQMMRKLLPGETLE